MGIYHQAADVLKREAQRYEALMQAAKALEEIGSLDQAADEAKTRKQTYEDAAESAKATMGQIVSATKVAKEAYEANHEKALNDASAIKADALAAADKIIADAKAEGVRINQIATDSAKATTAQAAKKLDELASKHIELIDKLAKREADISAMEDDAIAAEERLANIKAAIAKYSA